MDYPTIDQVNAADRERLCTWWRFLQSPGTQAFVTSPDPVEISAAIDREALVMQRIRERFFEAGGFTPEISKRIGWGELTGLVAES